MEQRISPSSLPDRKPAAARLIVALDFPSAEEALHLVDRLDGRCRWFKVGLELYLGAGPAILQTLRDRGFDIFLDLKLHDIPNTVAAAVRSLANSGASLLTVHASGGPAMLAAAQEASCQSPHSPRLLAVTVLTSMDLEQLESIGVQRTSPNPVAGQVARLGSLARNAGIPGLVCSPHEVAGLRTLLGPAPLLVVPGIRPSTHLPSADDQRRIATAGQAMADGASMLVVGRPITRAHDPLGALNVLLEEIAPHA